MSLKLVAAAAGFRGSPVQRLHPRCIRKYANTRHCSSPSSSPSSSDESQSLRWHLISAVCLERYPVVSQDLGAIESEYQEMIDTVELENSLLSDHELQLILDKEKTMRRQGGLADDDDEDDAGDLVSALDLEDQYTEVLNQFKPASRSSETDDPRSIHRKLMDKLVLLVKCRVGDSSLWMMPQGTRQDGESMRQAAERVVASQCGLAHWRARFMGNAPNGCYKYVYPPNVQDEKGVKGAKIFFFKARLMDKDVEINKEVIEDYAWVTSSEIDNYTIPSYRETVRKFIVPVTMPV